MDLHNHIIDLITYRNMSVFEVDALVFTQPDKSRLTIIAQSLF